MFYSRLTRSPHHLPPPNLSLPHVRCRIQQQRPRLLSPQHQIPIRSRQVPYRSNHHVANPNPQTSFHKSPPTVTFPKLSYPTPQILLVTLSRPRSLNCVSTDGHYELEELFKWYDDEPQLRCAVLTGAGRAFCAGADLKEWDRLNKNRTQNTPEPRPRIPPSGFGGLGNKQGKKPIIGAVNGLALGGGFEIASAMDMIVAAKSATFALPEAKRGVGALTGVLPRLNRMVGKHRALEMALTGRTYTAGEMERWGLVNAVVEDAKAPEEEGEEEDVMARPVVRKALEYAQAIVENSPDSVIVMRDAVLSAWYDGDMENASRVVEERWAEKLNAGENIKEGVKAFVEKRAPKWVNSSL